MTAGQDAEGNDVAQRVNLNAEALLLRRAVLLRAGDAAVKHIAKAAEHQTEDCQQRVAGDGQPDAGHGRQQAEVGQNDRVIIETNHK